MRKKDITKEIPSWTVATDETKEASRRVPKKRVVKVQMRKRSSRMDRFFRDVEAVKSDIDAIKIATAEIARLSDHAARLTVPQEENATRRQLDVVVGNANECARTAKETLCRLENETKTLKLKGTKLNESDERIRVNLCSTLTRKYCEEIQHFYTAQQNLKSQTLCKIKRQVRIVDPNATDEDISKVLESEGGIDKLYEKVVLAGGVSDEIESIYDKIAGRYQDVLKLESSIAQLHQMFLDVALLVERQGDLFDQIEYQLQTAGDYVEDGNDEIHNAIRYQKKLLRKRVIRGLVIVVVAIVVVIVVVI